MAPFEFMNSAQEYRRKAEEAYKMAEKSTDQNIKRAYVEIAKEWRLLAARAERDG